jgi:DNA-binding Lrp family transcriptional regulator
MLLAQDVSDLESCFDMLSRTIPEISFKKSVCEIMKVTLFTPKRLSERTLQVNSLSYFPLSTVAPIDFTDHRILCSLGQNANPSTAVIARQLGLPVSTVTYRIKAMRDSGVIPALGYSASVFDDGRIPFGLLISVVRTSPAFRTTFWDFCCAHPAVSALLTVSGPWEHQVEVEVRDARAVSAVVQEFYEAFPQNIDEIVTIPIGSMHKLTPYPFSADSSIVRSRTVARTDSL